MKTVSIGKSALTQIALTAFSFLYPRRSLCCLCPWAHAQQRFFGTRESNSETLLCKRQPSYRSGHCLTREHVAGAALTIHARMRGPPAGRVWSMDGSCARLGSVCPCVPSAVGDTGTRIACCWCTRLGRPAWWQFFFSLVAFFNASMWAPLFQYLGVDC